MGIDQPTAPERLPAALVEHLDALKPPELRAVRSYAGQRIAYLRDSITNQIRANAAGEVVDITDLGAYTLVRVRQPDHGDSRRTYLYRVKEGPRLSGEETLQWSFLGEVYDVDENSCEQCGVSLPSRADVCPQCGADETGRGV